MSDKLKACPFCGEIPKEYTAGARVVCTHMVRCATNFCAVGNPIHRDRWQQRAREPVLDKLLEACEAGVVYDEAIQECANDPKKMATSCTAQGDTLDSLYADWISKTRAAIAEAEPTRTG